LGNHSSFENRPGAGGNIGTGAVATSPDRYTLLVVTASNAITATLYQKSISMSSAT